VPDDADDDAEVWYTPDEIVVLSYLRAHRDDWVPMSEVLAACGVDAEVVYGLDGFGLLRSPDNRLRLDVGLFQDANHECPDGTPLVPAFVRDQVRGYLSMWCRYC